MKGSISTGSLGAKESTFGEMDLPTQENSGKVRSTVKATGLKASSQSNVRLKGTT